MKFKIITLYLVLAILDSIMFQNAIQAQPPQNIFTQFYRFENNRPSRFYDLYNLGDGYAICGLTRSSSWLVITASNGDLITQRAYFPEAENISSSLSRTLIETDDSGLVLGGYCHVELMENTPRAFSIFKTDDNYDIEWWRNYNVGGWAECKAVIELKSDELLASGYSNRHAYAVKLDMDGVIIWEHHYEGTTDFRAIRETDDGYLFAGSYNLVLTDEEGDVIWNRRLDGLIYSLISA